MSEDSEGESLASAVMRRLRPAPFWTHVGARLEEAAPGRAVICVPMRPEFGRSGIVAEFSAHGGLVATALDMAASCALITTLAEDEGRATVDLAVHYLEPATADLIATATVRRRGKRNAVVDMEVDSGGRLCALGRATFAILRSG